MAPEFVRELNTVTITLKNRFWTEFAYIQGMSREQICTAAVTPWLMDGLLCEKMYTENLRVSCMQGMKQKMVHVSCQIEAATWWVTKFKTEIMSSLSFTTQPLHSIDQCWWWRIIKKVIIACLPCLKGKSRPWEFDWLMNDFYSQTMPFDTIN